MFHRSGEKLTWCPSTRKAKTEQRWIVTDLSVSSAVWAKLMERLINTRLTWHMEKNNIITPEQAGFRQHRSTEDQVTYIAQKIEDGFQDRKHTPTVWIDMEKAFDRVWKEGLKIKLQKCGVSGCMFQWICQYLNKRKARVYLSGEYNRRRLKE